jgi:diguanylate cyclase (GGDEF)-like protein
MSTQPLPLEPSTAPASVAELTEQAWELSYLDAAQALALGRRIVAATRHEPESLAAGYGWLIVALVEARIGEPQVAADATDHARAVFARVQHVRGMALADEVRAIHLRRAGDFAGSGAVHDTIDALPARDYTDHDQFVAHNSRAITCKHLGRVDDALRHFYQAYAAARRTGWPGPEILALGNLGGFHQDLYNLDDARSLSEQALNMARLAGARQTIATTAANLIVTHHAAGQPAEARALAEFLLTHGHELAPGALDHFPMQMALAFYGAGEFDTAQRYLDRGAIGALGDGDGKAFWSWLQARCHLAQARAGEARTVVEAMIDAVEIAGVSAQPYDLVQLYRAAADCCEELGDLAAALRYTRRSHEHYEEMLGRSARARYIALEVTHQIDAARHERDQAVASRDSAEDDRARLAAMNRQLQAKIAEIESLHAQLKEQALRDPLTGLHNRRYLFEVAPRMLSQAARREASLCVVVLDLDRFKTLNDNFGHQAGDEVLRAFARLLTDELRGGDVICRHGGEEFVIVMPDIHLVDADALLSRLLQRYAALRLVTPKHHLPALSFSAGIAVFPGHGNTLELLLSRADRALYAAKDAGRSRIEVAQLTGFSTLN